MSAQFKYQAKTIQTNTGKEKDIFMKLPFTNMTANEFRRQIAQREHVPMSSIQLVGYDKFKFDLEF